MEVVSIEIANVGLQYWQLTVMCRGGSCDISIVVFQPLLEYQEFPLLRYAVDLKHLSSGSILPPIIQSCILAVVDSFTNNININESESGHNE